MTAVIWGGTPTSAMALCNTLSFGGLEVHRINKVQGQPFLVKEVVDGVINIMDKQ